MKKKNHLKKGLNPAQAAVILDNLEQIKALLYNAPGHIVQPIHGNEDEDDHMYVNDQDG